MQSKISVIIPVYNTKEYLEECVHSVCMQSYQNIEILLVDDGSTDGSGALGDTLASTLSTGTHAVLSLHKENGGLADARNYGIAHATGTYLLFLDSDDYYLSADDIATLMQHAEAHHCDVLCFNYTRNEAHTPERACSLAYSDQITDLVQQNIYTSSACLKLLRRTVLDAQNICFIKGQCSEDILFSGKLLADPSLSVAFLNRTIYFYRVRETSLTNSIKEKNITDTIAILHDLEALSAESANTPITAKNARTTPLLAYTAFQYATLLINIQLCAQPLSKEMLLEIYQMKYLLRYNTSFSVRCIYLCSKCIGVRATSHLLSLAFRAKRVICK